VVLTGGKEQEKVYSHHSGYPGGLTQTVYARLLAERPSFAVERAVRGMIPKNRLGRQIVRKLSVYDGPDHPHGAQKPTPLAIGEVPPWTGLPERKPHTAKRRREAPVEVEEAPAKAKAASGRKSSARKSTTRKSTASTGRRSTSTGSRSKSGTRSSGSGAKGSTSAPKQRIKKES
jgi:hypothetical protein